MTAYADNLKVFCKYIMNVPDNRTLNQAGIKEVFVNLNGINVRGIRREKVIESKDIPLNDSVIYDNKRHEHPKLIDTKFYNLEHCSYDIYVDGILVGTAQPGLVRFGFPRVLEEYNTFSISFGLSKISDTRTYMECKSVGTEAFSSFLPQSTCEKLNLRAVEYIVHVDIPCQGYSVDQILRDVIRKGSTYFGQLRRIKGSWLSGVKSNVVSHTLENGPAGMITSFNVKFVPGDYRTITTKIDVNECIPISEWKSFIPDQQILGASDRIDVSKSSYNFFHYGCQIIDRDLVCLCITYIIDQVFSYLSGSSCVFSPKPETKSQYHFRLFSLLGFFSNIIFLGITVVSVQHAVFFLCKVNYQSEQRPNIKSQNLEPIYGSLWEQMAFFQQIPIETSDMFLYPELYDPIHYAVFKKLCVSLISWCKVKISFQELENRCPQNPVYYPVFKTDDKGFPTIDFRNLFVRKIEKLGTYSGEKFLQYPAHNFWACSRVFQGSPENLIDLSLEADHFSPNEINKEGKHDDGDDDHVTYEISLDDSSSDVGSVTVNDSDYLEGSQMEQYSDDQGKKQHFLEHVEQKRLISVLFRSN